MKNHIKFYRQKKRSIQDMKRRSIYECAVYCHTNKLNLKTFKRDLKGYPKDVNEYVFVKANWFQCLPFL